MQNDSDKVLYCSRGSLKHPKIFALINLLLWELCSLPSSQQALVESLSPPIFHVPPQQKGKIREMSSFSWGHPQEEMPIGGSWILILDSRLIGQAWWDGIAL